MKLESVGIYTRVSTALQFETGSSLEEQQTRTRKYCESMGWPVFKVYTDGGYSGANLERPALQEMIRDVKAGRINRVLVYKLDRLSRSQRDTLNLIENVFLANNCDFVSMSENFDTSTPFGRASIGILAVFAQLEREQIKERMAMGRDARKKQGHYIGNGQAIGYDYENGQLVVNEYEAMLIRKVFDMLLSGIGICGISTQLNKEGLLHKHGRWNKQRVKYILQNRLYTGEIHYHDGYIDGVHEAIIDKDTFEKAQVILKKREHDFKENNSRPGKINSCLGGLIYCANCGAKFIKTTKHFNLKNGSRATYCKYICSSRARRSVEKVKDASCMNKIWTMEQLDNIIFEQIKGLDFETIKASPEKKDFEADVLRDEIAKINKSIEKLIDLYTLDGIDKQTLQTKILSLESQRNQLEEKASGIESIEHDVNMDRVESVLDNFGDILEQGNTLEIRAAIGELIDRIEIDNENVTIFWAFS